MMTSLQIAEFVLI